MSAFPTFFLVIPLLLFFSSGVLRGAVVEFSADKAPLSDGAVGTCGYEPTETEKKFFVKLSEADRSTIQTKPGEFNKRSLFRLSSHRSQFVSWWGIVREIKTNPNGAGGSLLIENKYDDGLTDCHIETVSIYGAGDFEVELSEIPEDLIPLVLVRVYGVVSDELGKHPVVKADYLRVWHWFQFNFMDFGQDHSSEQGKKRRKVPRGEMIYAMGVSPKYYDERLGPTPEEWDQIRTYHRGQTELEFQTEWLSDKQDSGQYEPTDGEQRYFDRLRKEERATVQTAEDGAPGFALRGHLHQYVSWFGIVREVKPVIGKRGGTVLIENKYFKGAGDPQLMTVSINGAGDFQAEMTNLSEELVPLMLVRVYGTVTREDGNVPVVETAFLHGWHWGQFNFDKYGVDHGNPQWKTSIDLKEPIHQTAMNADYYIKRLGPSKEQAQKIVDAFKWKEENEKSKRELEKIHATETKVEP